MTGFAKTALQCAIAVAVLVPILAGAAGMMAGPAMMGLDHAVASDLDSHYRYLSGLLLGIGLAFAASIPNIERNGRRIRLLAGIVVIGGAGRLYAVFLAGHASRTTMLALAMELLVTPGLALWQHRLERRPPSFEGRWAGN